MKKEQTIEQASEYYAHNYFDMHETNNYKALKEGFVNGAKWQQERMYSEEVEVEDLWNNDNELTHSHYEIIIPKEKPKQETLEEVPTKLESVLAKITHQNDLGLSQWYEVVYYVDGKWCSYNGSKTFEDGERVVEWKYCKELI